MKKLVVALFILFLNGCATQGFMHYKPTPEKWFTRDIAIISDTQIHENKGESNRFLGKAGDKVIPVTLRPSQQTIGAPEVLRRVIQDIPSNTPILHLGDAMDISCICEWEYFVKIMNDATQEWVFVPGNHDGYLAGNFHPVYGGEQYFKKDQWYQICNKGRYYNIEPIPPRIMDKNTLISEYIGLLSKKYSGYGIDPSKQRDRILVGDTTFLKCISWKIDKINPWRSYIFQMVNLPLDSSVKINHSILLFDTSNYYFQPQAAGVKGQITRDQLLDAAYFISNLSDDSIYSFGGHHPLKELNIKGWKEKDKIIFEELINHKKALSFYISSHTHDGFWKDHIIGNQIVTELNIGSINDAPVYYRNLKLGFSTNDGYIIDSKINDLKDIYGDNLCNDTNLPPNDQPHSIKNQDTDNWISAVYYFFAFWKSKHHEIEPELFVYRDLLLEFVHEDCNHGMYYDWDDDSKIIKNRKELLKEIDCLYKCKKDKCPERRKARFIIALAEFIESNTDDVQGLHDKMACLSIMAAEEDAGNHNTQKTRKSIMPERVCISSH